MHSFEIEIKLQNILFLFCCLLFVVVDYYYCCLIDKIIRFFFYHFVENSNSNWIINFYNTKIKNYIYIYHSINVLIGRLLLFIFHSYKRIIEIDSIYCILSMRNNKTFLSFCSDHKRKERNCNKTFLFFYYWIVNMKIDCNKKKKKIEKFKYWKHKIQKKEWKTNYIVDFYCS